MAVHGSLSDRLAAAIATAVAQSWADGTPAVVDATTAAVTAVLDEDQRERKSPGAINVHMSPSAAQPTYAAGLAAGYEEGLARGRRGR